MKPRSEFVRWVKTPIASGEVHSIEKTAIAQDRIIAEYHGGRRAFATSGDQFDDNFVVDLSVLFEISLAEFREYGSSIGLTISKIHVEIRNSILSLLEINAASFRRETSLLLENCHIHTLRLRAPLRIVTLKDCHIGSIEFLSPRAGAFSINGGSLLSLSFPAAHLANPIRNEVTLSKQTYLPRSHAATARPTAQGFRNLRHHIADSGDFDLTMRLHATEERIERPNLDWAGRQFSRIYDWFSSYGASITRPFVILLALWLFVVGGLAYFDLTQPPASVYCVGWRTTMCEPTRLASLTRAVVVGTQPISLASNILSESPLSRPIAKYGWVEVGLVVEGILSLIVLAFAFIAIRRRFRLQM